MKNTELKTAVADRLARISAQSTLNLFISKEVLSCKLTITILDDTYLSSTQCSKHI